MRRRDKITSNPLENLFKSVLKKGSLDFKVLTLSGGTGIGLLIIFLASPLLSRLYTPSDFGIYSSFISLATITATMASLKYEWVIPLPKDDKDSLNVLFLCAILVVISTSFFAVIIVILKLSLTDLSFVRSMDKYFFFLPVCFFLIGIYNVLNYWGVRKAHFAHIAKSKISLAYPQAAIQLILGYLSANPLGLIVGDLAGKLVGALMLIKSLWPTINTHLKELSPRSILNLSRRYKHFPLIAGPSSVLNSISLRIPVLILSFLYERQVKPETLSDKHPDHKTCAQMPLRSEIPRFRDSVIPRF